jgi:hypothetical protein
MKYGGKNRLPNVNGQNFYPGPFPTGFKADGVCFPSTSGAAKRIPNYSKYMRI